MRRERGHQKDGSFLLSQNVLVGKIREIPIPSHRRKEKDSPVSEQEQTELRGLLGGHGWKCKQTGPQHSAATGLQRSRIEQATVQDMIEATRLLPQVKKENGQAIRIFSFATEERSVLIGWSDAASEKRDRWSYNVEHVLCATAPTGAVCFQFLFVFFLQRRVLRRIRLW